MVSQSFSALDFVVFLWANIGLVALLYGGGLYFTRYLHYKLKYNNIKSSDIYHIDHMTPEQFSNFAVKIFERHGYYIKTTAPKNTEDAIDFVIMKEEHQIAVVIRHTPPRFRVGSKWVIHAHNGARLYGCNDAMVITNGFFTPKAKLFGEECEVKMYSRNELIGFLSHLRNAKRGSAGARSVIGDSLEARVLAQAEAETEARLSVSAAVGMQLA